MKDGTKEYQSLNKNCIDDQTVINALIRLIFTIRLRYPQLPRMAREKRQKITKLLLKDFMKCCSGHPFVKEIESKISEAEKLSPKVLKTQYPYWQQGNVIIGKDHYQQLFPQSFWLVAKNIFLTKIFRLNVFSERCRSLDRFLEFLMSAQFYPGPILTEIDMDIVLNLLRGTQYNWNRYEIVQLVRRQIAQTSRSQKSRAVLMQRYASIINSGIVSYKHLLNFRPFGLKLFVREVFESKNQNPISPTFQKELINVNCPTISLQEWNLVVQREEDIPSRRKGVNFYPVQKIVITYNLSLRNWSEFLEKKTVYAYHEKDSNHTQVSIVQRQRKAVREFIQRYPFETIRFLEIRSMYPYHKLSSLRSTFGDISLYRLKKVSRILREEETMKITASTLDFFPNHIFISLNRQMEDRYLIRSFLLRFPVGMWFYTSKKIFLFIYLSHKRFACGFRELMDFRNEIALPKEEFQIMLIPFTKVHMSSSWLPITLIKEIFSFN